MTTVGLLAAGGESAKSGPIGLAVILLLCIACYFLFKSMSKHLRTVREDFPKDASDAAQPPPDAPQPPSVAPQIEAAPDPAHRVEGGPATES